MRIAVAGGTGAVGRLVVEAARAHGDEPVVLARSVGADVVTGNGLSEALTGADVVIDVSNVSTMRRTTAEAFFDAASRNLLAAGQAAGVGHHIALSIVGIDRVNLGYYAGKRRQEELVLAGPVPATVLRATQFHEFALQLLERSGPLPLVPVMRSQPVAAREVAAALVRAAHQPPAGMAPELAGPEQHLMPDLVRRVLRAQGRRRPVVPLRLPGAAGTAMASGGLMPTTAGPRGTQTFDQWLAATVTAPGRTSGS